MISNYTGINRILFSKAKLNIDFTETFLSNCYNANYTDCKLILDNENLHLKYNFDGSVKFSENDFLYLKNIAQTNDSVRAYLIFVYTESIYDNYEIDILLNTAKWDFDNEIVECNVEMADYYKLLESNWESTINICNIGLTTYTVNCTLNPFAPTIELQNARRVIDILKYGLEQIGLTCEDSMPDMSTILNDSNPIDLFIWQKSDVKRPNEPQPATVGNITLKELFDYLWGMYSINYYFDSNGKLHLYHQKHLYETQYSVNGLNVKEIYDLKNILNQNKSRFVKQYNSSNTNNFEEYKFDNSSIDGNMNFNIDYRLQKTNELTVYRSGVENYRYYHRIDKEAKKVSYAFNNVMNYLNVGNDANVRDEGFTFAWAYNVFNVWNVFGKPQTGYLNYSALNESSRNPQVPDGIGVVTIFKMYSGLSKYGIIQVTDYPAFWKIEIGVTYYDFVEYHKYFLIDFIKTIPNKEAVYQIPIQAGITRFKDISNFTFFECDLKDDLQTDFFLRKLEIPLNQNYSELTVIF